jgi:hypothetical protein
MMMVRASERRILFWFLTAQFSRAECHVTSRLSVAVAMNEISAFCHILPSHCCTGHCCTVPEEQGLREGEQNYCSGFLLALERCPLEILPPSLPTADARFQ